MKINQLEKATKLHKELAELDSSIILIERLANTLASKKCKVSMSLSVEDLEKEEEGAKVQFDEDGSIVNSDSIYEQMKKQMYGGWMITMPSLQCDKKDHSTKFEINEGLGLHLLGVLLCEKNGRRQEIMNKLTKLGIVI